ncbi:hypothetical protein [Sphingosinicella sp. BN140058]|uniref:hypothetical protein n=1 Tax=Sphingosinicella sp. BN140058 TaxID=1892855 RepID=UPI001013224A|nr:hypothetical protein [Sphingosinicella sp. BN140058]QAY80492.1 hypothetical protein ETR14_26090 [Sphingosinicella sp. BN140058]
MASSDFDRPRSILDARGIPMLARTERIGLVGAYGASRSFLERSGARRAASDWWYIERKPAVDLVALDRFLPRLAKRSLVPELVDLIPETSWCASLANMLTSSSWRVLRDVTIARAVSCQDCGAATRLECHETWTYDISSGLQRLMGMMALCSDCHETRHLGYATVRNRFDVAFRRLVTINRIGSAEEADYRRAIHDKYELRSQIDWTLDLSVLAGRKLDLKPAFVEVAPNLLMGKGRRGSIEVALAGVSVVRGAAASRGLMLS